MSCTAKTFPIPWTTLYAISAVTPVFVPCTPWMPTPMIWSARIVLELRHKVGDIEVTPYLQYANVEDTPSGTTAIGGERTTVGFYYDDFADVKSTLSGYQLVRFGFNVVNNTTTTRNLVRAAGRVEIRPF